MHDKGLSDGAVCLSLKPKRFSCKPWLCPDAVQHLEACIPGANQLRILTRLLSLLIIPSLDDFLQAFCAGLNVQLHCSIWVDAPKAGCIKWSNGADQRSYCCLEQWLLCLIEGARAAVVSCSSAHPQQCFLQVLYSMLACL